MRRLLHEMKFAQLKTIPRKEGLKRNQLRHSGETGREALNALNHMLVSFFSPIKMSDWDPNTSLFFKDTESWINELEHPSVFWRATEIVFNLRMFAWVTRDTLLGPKWHAHSEHTVDPPRSVQQEGARAWGTSRPRVQCLGRPCSPLLQQHTCPACLACYRVMRDSWEPQLRTTTAWPTASLSNLK